MLRNKKKPKIRKINYSTEIIFYFSLLFTYFHYPTSVFEPQIGSQLRRQVLVHVLRPHLPALLQAAPTNLSNW